MLRFSRTYEVGTTLAFGRNRIINELEWKYEAPKLLAAYEAVFA